MAINFQGGSYPSLPQTITYYGADLANFSVFNGGLYTAQAPANYWQKGVLLRDAQTDGIAIPIPQNWESKLAKIKVYAARAGGTASLKDFVLQQRSRYMATPIGEQTQQLADTTNVNVTRSFIGDNSICFNFEITFELQAFSQNQIRTISLQRLGSDAADTMDTSLIIYQIDVTQVI
jgi:hypothetical protein